MFIKDVYKNAFSIPNWRVLERKSLFKAIVYVLMLVFFCGGVSVYLGYLSNRDYIENLIEGAYNSIPEFTLSEEGFSIDAEVPIEIPLPQTNIYIDDSRELAQLIIEEKVENEREVIFIGSDGYGVVNGTTLEKANYYETIYRLQGVTLSKSDFDAIYEVIDLFIKDAFFIAGLFGVILFAIFVFIKSLSYSIVIKVILKYKGIKALFKNILKVALYSHTFYILYYGIILLSPMNISFLPKMMIFELISLFYIVFVGLNYKKRRRLK